MIHLAIGLLAISLTFVFFVVLSFMSPDAHGVNGPFIVGTAIAFVLSTVLVGYVRAQRL